MARQVKQLQMENSNMYFIKDENVSLKDELAGVRKQLSMRNEAPLDGGAPLSSSVKISRRESRSGTME